MRSIPCATRYSWHICTGKTAAVHRTLTGILKYAMETVLDSVDKGTGSYEESPTTPFAGQTVRRRTRCLGMGRASVAVTGMTWSGFRPSDDSCRRWGGIPTRSSRSPQPDCPSHPQAACPSPDSLPCERCSRNFSYDPVPLSTDPGRSPSHI